MNYNQQKKKTMFAEYRIDDLNVAGKKKLSELRALIPALQFFKQHVENYKTKSGQYKIITEAYMKRFCKAYEEKTGTFVGFGVSKYTSVEPGYFVITLSYSSPECRIEVFNPKTHRYLECAPANIQAEIDKLKADVETLAPLYTDEACQKRKVNILEKMKVAKKALQELNAALDYPRTLVKSNAAKNCGGLPYMSISTLENH